LALVNITCGNELCLEDSSGIGPQCLAASRSLLAMKRKRRVLDGATEKSASPRSEQKCAWKKEALKARGWTTDGQALFIQSTPGCASNKIFRTSNFYLSFSRQYEVKVYRACHCGGKARQLTWADSQWKTFKVNEVCSVRFSLPSGYQVKLGKRDEWPWEEDMNGNRYQQQLWFSYQKVTDAEPTVTFGQPSNPGGTYDHRSSDPIIVKNSLTCRNLNQITCGGDEKELCLKWGEYCFAGWVEVPPFVTVKAYDLGAAWNFNNQDCASDPTWTHELGEDQKNAEWVSLGSKRPCAFSFEMAKNYELKSCTD